MDIENICIITWYVYCEVRADMEETIQCRASIHSTIFFVQRKLYCVESGRQINNGQRAWRSCLWLL